MRSLAIAVADRWYAMRAHVAGLMPKRFVDSYRDLQIRLDNLPVPTVGSSAWDWCLASALIVLGPLLVATLLLTAFCGGQLWNCAPVWNDEIWYFNELSVFEAAGWTGGYTVCHEQPARAEWVRFGVHGPFGAAIYGGFARLTGTHWATIPILNAILVALGSLVWVACCRLNVRQSWAAALLMVTFWPLILYLPSSMQEGLHFSIAFLLAALLVLLMRQPANNWLLALTLVAVALAAQVRVTWAWVAAPAMWVAMRPRNLWQMGLLVAGCAPFIGALYIEAIMLVSPYPNFMSTVLEGAMESPLATCGMIFEHAFKGIKRFVSPTRDTLVQVAFRYQVLIVAGVAAYQLRRRYGGRSGNDTEAENSERPATESTAYIVALLNLFCIAGFVIAFYDVRDWRDYRVVAPHLLLSLLVLVACGSLEWLKRYSIVAVMVSVLAAVQFVEFHRARTTSDVAQAATFADQVSDAVRFSAGADGWDNTMLMDVQSMSAQELLFLPRGIGITSVVSWDQQAWPPRSRYVLLRRERANALEIPRSMHKVAETRIGDVYRNEPDRDSRSATAAAPANRK
jgi:hypothetical protein